MTAKTVYYSTADEIDLNVEREASEYAPVVLNIVADSDSLRIYCGTTYDDAETLASMLEALAKSAREIVDEWKDVPDADGDGFVFSGRDGYLVQLEGLHWNGTTLASHSGRRLTYFPTRKIAEYELARAMAHAGCFPNVWYEDERGWTDDIGERISREHFDPSDGGVTVRPLEGVEYEPGTYLNIDGWTAVVERDYGNLGITYHLVGDDETNWMQERTLILGVHA